MIIFLKEKVNVRANSCKYSLAEMAEMTLKIGPESI